MPYKICPICKSTVFADMDTCYGCMYRFGSKPELEQQHTAETPSVSEEIVGSPKEGSALCVEFLVELQSFLRDFLLDRKVGVDELIAGR